MEIDDLIKLLEDFADVADGNGLGYGGVICRKSAETIKLLRECVVDADNEKWHRMIDDMEKKDAEQSS